MTNSCLPLSIFGFVLPILLIFSGGILRPVNGQAPGQGAWCISQPSASEQALMENINYACKMVDCSTIQPGGLCYYPVTLANHASVVMNLYFQKLGRHFWNCDFNNSGIIVVTDPSHGDCKYQYAKY